MDKKEALEKLKQELSKITSLRELPCNNDVDNEEFKLLRFRVLDIIEVAFGKKSSEYRRIPIMPICTLTFHKTEDQRKQEYNEFLDTYDTALKSIIQKHEMLGDETKLSKVKKLIKFPIIKIIWRWIKSHRIISITITLIMLVAAIITIVRACKGL